MRKGAAGSSGNDPKFRRVELPAPLRMSLLRNAPGFPSGGVFIFRCRCGYNSTQVIHRQEENQNLYTIHIPIGIFSYIFHIFNEKEGRGENPYLTFVIPFYRQTTA
jgi:hypothetical protein